MYLPDPLVESSTSKLKDAGQPEPPLISIHTKLLTVPAFSETRLDIDRKLSMTSEKVLESFDHELSL